MAGMLQRGDAAALLMGLRGRLLPGGGSGAGFVNTDITGAELRQEISASPTTTTGARTQPGRLSGKVVTLFWLRAAPRRARPTWLNMVEVSEPARPDADKVQVLFMTIDPSAIPRPRAGRICRPSIRASSGSMPTCPRPRRWPRISRSLPEAGRR